MSQAKSQVSNKTHEAHFPELSSLQQYAETNLPTEFGTFRLVIFREPNSHVEHMAMIIGDIENSEDLPVRVHSECFTGEVLHSYKCDCREQLHAGLRHIAEQERGLLIYLRQEGRGIGLGNKIRAYALQEHGHDTVEANRMLGFGDDLRTYEAAAQILQHFGVQSICLLTNNPLKLEALEKYGIVIKKRVPLICPVNEHSIGYFRTKQERMGHMFDVSSIDKEKTKTVSEAPIRANKPNSTPSK